MAVTHQGSGSVEIAPTLQSSAPRQISVFVIQEQTLVKNTDRVKNRAVLVPMLEKIMMTRNKARWLAALEAAKVPCGAINNLHEVFQDPQVLARQMVNTWQHPLQADLKLVASPLKLSLTPVQQAHVPPQLGQHSSEVLQEVLGYSHAQIEGLKSKGII
jgi:crotonobetainyl-CoA:carnitine CoA-transferase CaiB-like acyl-CoA transferase